MSVLVPNQLRTFSRFVAERLDSAKETSRRPVVTAKPGLELTHLSRCHHPQRRVY
jgi:hypothetical protein